MPQEPEIDIASGTINWKSADPKEKAFRELPPHPTSAGTYDYMGGIHWKCRVCGTDLYAVGTPRFCMTCRERENNEKEGGE